MKAVNFTILHFATPNTMMALRITSALLIQKTV